MKAARKKLPNIKVEETIRSMKKTKMTVNKIIITPLNTIEYRMSALRS